MARPSAHELEQKVFRHQESLRRLNDTVRELEQELEATRRILHGIVHTTCREWCEEKDGDPNYYNRCNEPAEFILWGKLIDDEGLGPRCYDHARKWVGASALSPNSDYALVDLRPARMILGLERSRR